MEDESVLTDERPTSCCWNSDGSLQHLTVNDEDTGLWAEDLTRMWASADTCDGERSRDHGVCERESRDSATCPTQTGRWFNSSRRK